MSSAPAKPAAKGGKPGAKPAGPNLAELDRKTLRKQAQMAVRLARPEGSGKLEKVQKAQAARAAALIDLLLQVVEVRARPSDNKECDYLYEVMRRDAVEYLEKAGVEKSIWQSIGS